MKCEIFNHNGTVFLRTEDITPVCGLDFCDECGDCLACYGGDECLDITNGIHRFVRYEDEGSIRIISDD